MKTIINKEIFRQYDIRGIVDNDLTPETVYFLGRGFGTYLIKGNFKTCVIGGDARLSSPLYIEKFSKGLTECGVDVVDGGIMATPCLYWAIQHLNTDAGVMITGSHNPPEFNGFKLNIGCTGSIFGDEIQKIYDYIANEDFVSGKGTLAKEDNIVELYIQDLISRFTLEKPVKVVIDAGNGAGGPIAPAILKGIGADVKELYCEQDGTFPNHHPDPTVPEYMKDLISEVKNSDYAVGIGLDGDADRIGVVDENGEMLFGDQILNIFARDFLKNNPGEKVVADVKCSKNFYDDVSAHGGKAIMYKTGHSMIKKKMSEDKIKFGGEMSGHIFFKDIYFGFDDAIYATCRFLEILSKSDKKVSQMLEDLPKVYNTPEIRFDCEDSKKFDIVEKVKLSFMEQNYDCIDIDGVRVNFADGWGLIRASNTQPVLVMRFEATSKKRVEELENMFRAELDKLCK